MLEQHHCVKVKQSRRRKRAVAQGWRKADMDKQGTTAVEGGYSPFVFSCCPLSLLVLLQCSMSLSFSSSGSKVVLPIKGHIRVNAFQKVAVDNLRPQVAVVTVKC